MRIPDLYEALPRLPVTNLTLEKADHHGTERVCLRAQHPFERRVAPPSDSRVASSLYFARALHAHRAQTSPLETVLCRRFLLARMPQIYRCPPELLPPRDKK